MRRRSTQCLCAPYRTALHAEYFVDHVRIEKMLFDGIPSLIDGVLKPSQERPGFGFEFRQVDAEKYAL